MKGHPEIGAKALSMAEKQLEATLPKLVEEISLTHHEKWNGSGYPKGLKEQEIPISGRLMALADVMTHLSRTCIQKSLHHERPSRSS